MNFAVIPSMDYALLNLHMLQAGSTCAVMQLSALTPECAPGKYWGKAIADVCADPDNFEEGEIRPSDEAIQELNRVLAEALNAGTDIPQDAAIAPYAGEISITWRKDNRMLRLAVFSDGRPSRLDFGAMPEGALGEYHFKLRPSGAQLTSKLEWLKSGPLAATAL